MGKKLYFIKVLTPLHVGSGTGLEHIDLPIYREAHTDFPAIPSSAIKGAYRTKKIRELAKEIRDNKLKQELVRLLEVKKEDEQKYIQNPPKLVEELIERYPEIKEKGKQLEGNTKNVFDQIERLANIFGSRHNEGKSVFSDARILFFPVKSLKGIFAHVTCPYVIERFYEDIGRETNDINLEQNECIVLDEDKVVVNINGRKSVVLEDFVLNVKERKDINIPIPACMKDNKKRIVLVHDDIFTYMVKNCTEIQTHIKVDVEKGTVEDGALWTEEYVPSETVFYMCVEGYSISDGDRIQLGGNSSTGKGIVEVKSHEEC